MMRWIVGSSIKFRRLVSRSPLGLLVFGVLQLDNARTDILPEFQRPTVEVQTEALGLSAEEVEQLITVPLEQDLLVGDRRSSTRSSRCRCPGSRRWS